MLNLYKRVIEFTQDGVYRYDFETGKILFANRGLVKILDLDFKPEELTGKKLRDLIVYTEKEGTIRRALAQHGEIHQFEYHFKTLKGDSRWVIHDSFIVQDTEIGRLIVESIVRDITSRKLAEEKIRQEREWLDVTLKSIGDGTIATDSNGRIALMNPVAEALTGWNFNEARNKKLTQVFKIINANTRKSVENPVKKVLKHGRIVGLANHTILISRDGIEYQIADSAAPIYDRNDNIIGVILVFQDVTDQYRMQKRLLQQQKMEVLGNLAGGIAHDFNNMLTGILGFSELLENKLQDKPKLQRFASEIKKAGSSASRLANKLLSFSRKKQFQGKPVNVHEAIKAVVEILNHTIDKRIKISKRLEANSAMISGDPSLLQNAILNLALNARDAMPKGGKLMFATSNISLDKEFCQKHAVSLNPGKYLEIDIKDTGIGMSKNQLEHAFEPFFTTKIPGHGTGLGLSVVFGTITHHNGWVNVYSEPGMGTLIKIYLPIAEGIKTDKPKERKLYKGSGLILVVDDEPIIRATINEMLNELGYDVILAEDGEQAVEIYKRKQAEISLVLLDMVMPKITGIETFARLKEICPTIKVLFCSGFAPEGVIDELFSAGASGYVSKPFNLETIGREISTLLNK
ncbi:MAG: hybrid sensor histidine kinase/response regulator [Candidatus Rifleibacteriota bacterium]